MTNNLIYVRYILVICLFAIIIQAFNWEEWLKYIKNLIKQDENKKKEKYDLVIGILSSQSNMIQRDAIRKTWLSVLDEDKKLKIKVLFLVAEKPCAIPVEYRMNEYDCTWWNPNISAIKTSSSTEFLSNTATNEKDYKQKKWKIVHQGFSFQVNYPVVVTRLGVLSEVMSHNSTITVSLINGPLKETVIKTEITSEELSVNINGFLYRSVTQYLLPKGFEGILLVEGMLMNSVCSEIQWNNGSGLISFQRIYKTAEDFNTEEFFDEYFVAPSFIFKLSNKEDIIKLEENKKYAIKNWMKNLQNMQLQLIDEMNNWNDILLIDVIEVYRNLPLKILKFFSWLTMNYEFSYVLKLDDDCMINVSKLLKELSSISNHDAKQRWWWSRFRHQWAINYFGKWRDYSYSSIAYPAFPCGGGYILSSDLVKWISRNDKFLYQFQGEDVSMGIWLSAINPKRFEDDRWNCEIGCDKNSFNRVQLSVTEMFNAWNIYLKCGNICNCE